MSLTPYNPVPAAVSKHVGAPATATRPLSIPAGWQVRDRFTWLPARLWKLDLRCYYTVREPCLCWLQKYVEITFPSGVVRGIYACT